MQLKTIAENVARIRERIARAAQRSGRAAERITLVAVTKYVSAEMVRPLVAAGCLELGESRPQQLWEKAAALADLPIRWHLIGHLQRNKVRRTLPLAAIIHSVDSRRLLAAIDEEASGKGPIPILLEVNVSGESAKHGFSPEQIKPLLAELPNYANVSVRGLMCMAGFEGGPQRARRDFDALRRLRDCLRPSCPPAVTLDELSMGMSGDFEEAIEEGATIVRVGSALFEGVDSG
ncbi:MAG: YggS family pyridoxal phosphate-dependent enzyme [Planctomycetes bacterium]|nr:YggS family pyridoxal phosphate-dependent enzyme [Planctomycetota bacterium]MBU4398912.1 YggS family pyridoxal phosphate-dependent enzyme [Planctomycetota bacterium]MCG2684448.1 YggS family pyridoxal phosphate-dependent enzyme [Planctomycetales bacterium]